MPEIDRAAEKRRDARYSLHLVGSAEALYRREIGAGGGGDQKAQRQNLFKVESVNVSRGGFLLTFDMEISAGDVIRLYFVHPVTKSELEMEGQIQWMRRNATPLMGRYVAGFSFRRIDENALSSLLEHAMANSPTPI